MQSTHSKLLKIMSQEMIRHGLKATRVDVVLDKVGVPKGLYIITSRIRQH